MREQTGADAVILCDTGGNILANTDPPEEKPMDLVTAAALGAGSYSATRQLALILREPGFRSIFHKGKQTNIFIHGVLTYYLLIIIFGNSTTAGLVKLYVEKAAREIEPILSAVDGQTSVSAGAEGQAFEVDPNAELFGGAQP